eukprot:237969-Chlamydomonas_euryale.AAC.3
MAAVSAAPRVPMSSSSGAYTAAAAAASSASTSSAARLRRPLAYVPIAAALPAPTHAAQRDCGRCCRGCVGGVATHAAPRSSAAGRCALPLPHARPPRPPPMAPWRACERSVAVAASAAEPDTASPSGYQVGSGRGEPRGGLAYMRPAAVLPLT